MPRPDSPLDDRATSFATPFDRLLGWTRRKEAAERVVMRGLAIAAASIVAYSIGASWFEQWARNRGAADAGSFVVMLLAAGALGRYRAGRWVIMLVAARFAIAGLFATLDAFGDASIAGRQRVAVLLMGLGMLGFASGVLLATVTAGARAWQQSREAKRAPKSLAEWRRRD